MWIKLIFIVSCCISIAESRGSGAPLSACEDMIPIHPGHVDQIGDLPVNIVVETPIVSGQLITIRIEGTTLLPSFGGFQIQARKQNHELIGKFRISENVGVINCADLPKSSATHTSSAQKTAVEIFWEAPITTELILFNFYVTIAGTFQTFWVNRRTPVYPVVPPHFVPTEHPTVPIDSTLSIEKTTTEAPTEAPTTPDPRPDCNCNCNCNCNSNPICPA